jgi:hypothetical protein
MAYFTITIDQRALTESESAQLASYISVQQAAGTTCGQRYNWPLTTNNDTLPSVQPTRMWSTTESANGYKDLFASFNPSIPVSVY